MMSTVDYKMASNVALLEELVVAGAGYTPGPLPAYLPAYPPASLPTCP